MTSRPKIIRDLLAARIPPTALSTCPPEERGRMLAEKLGEERDEFVASGYASLHELGDCLGVLRAMAADAGHAWRDVVAAERGKRRTHGGFSRGLVYHPNRDETRGGRT